MFCTFINVKIKYFAYQLNGERRFVAFGQMFFKRQHDAVSYDRHQHHVFKRTETLRLRTLTKCLHAYNTAFSG